MDPKCYAGATESFELDQLTLPHSNYPWISSGPGKLIMDIPDPETIIDGIHTSGKYTKGVAVEHFDLIVCAIHKPSEPFSDG